MAVDKLVDSSQLDADLTSVANAIRAKSGGVSQLAFPAGFVSEIGNIPTGGGSDAPTFTVVWDDNWEYEISVTCDKTYAECLALTVAESPINYCQILMTDQSQTAQFMETAGFIALIVDSGMQVDYLLYTMTAGLAPVLDVRYYDNGQVAIEMPSATAQTLTVASNGTYHPQTNKSLQEVIVNVPSTTVSPLSATQNGVYTAPQGEAYSPVTVNVSGGGGVEEVDAGAMFYDYDGTLLHSYSTAEVATLSALPANPSHTGLTAQGWNWTLQDIKAYLTSYPDAVVKVGQLYVTSDGKTKIYITLDRPSLTVNVRYTQTVTRGVEVDWGDGTVSTYTGTSASNRSHTYDSAGDYVIKLTVTTGAISFVGAQGTNAIYGSLSGIYRARYFVTKFECGDSVTTLDAALQQCYELKTVTLSKTVSIGANNFSGSPKLKTIIIPSGVTNIGNNFANLCTTLETVCLPNEVTTFGSSVFENCVNLRRITLPNALTSIGSNAFRYCYNLRRVIIPSSLTSINSYAFSDCRMIETIAIPSAVDSLGNYAFQNCYMLNSLEIKEGLTSIGSNGLESCYYLDTITLPSTLTNIAGNAFRYCYDLDVVISLATSPPTLASSSFSSTNITVGGAIYVPYSVDHSVLTAYQTATNWSTYASRILELPQ